MNSSLEQTSLIETPIPMAGFIAVGMVLAIPFAFFTYAAGHGLFLLFRSIEWSGRKLMLVALQAAIFLYLCLTNVAVMAPVTDLFQQTLVSSRMLLQSTQDASAAFFAHHAASSHTACGVMGVVIAAWIRGFHFVFPSLCPAERPPAPIVSAQSAQPEKQANKKSAEPVMVQPVGAATVPRAGVSTVANAGAVTDSRFVSMTVIMHALFSLGCFLWFRFCIAPTVAMYGMHMNMSNADALCLTSTHIVAFSLGFVVHNDFIRRRFYERSEMEMMQYYSLAYAAFITIPRVAAAMMDSVGLDPVSVLNFVVHAVASWCSLFALIAFTFVDMALMAPYWSLLWIGVAWAIKAVFFAQKPVFHDPNVPIPAAPYTVEEHARALDFLPPYPDGWYKLYRENEVVAGGAVRLAHVLGQHFAMYRLLDGTLVCRTIVESCVTSADYERLTTEQSARWNCIVWAHICLVYYTLAPLPDGRPPYEPLPLAGIVSGHLKYGGYLERDNCTLHLQDVAENAGDTAHFGMVHGRLNTPVLTNFFYIEHNVRFDPGYKSPVTGMNPHAVFHDNATLCAYYGGKKIPDSAPASVHFQGPGILVFKFATPKGDVIAIKTFMPRGPLCHRMDDEWYYDPALALPFAKFVLNEGVTAFGADITIWNRKTYFHKPLLCTGDGPIYQVRRWFRQFYNVHSLQLPPVPPRVYDTEAWLDTESATAAGAAGEGESKVAEIAVPKAVPVA